MAIHHRNNLAGLSRESITKIHIFWLRADGPLGHRIRCLLEGPYDTATNQRCVLDIVLKMTRDDYFEVLMLDHGTDILNYLFANKEKYQCP